MTFHRIRHPEWVERTTGALPYTRDLKPDGVLVAKVLRCPFPAAEIVLIDIEAARSIPGVAAVLTGSSLPERKYKDYGQFDRPVMATRRAHYFGQEVAAVAAESAEIADAAIARIVVQWKELPHVDTVADALLPDAVAVHPERGSDNVATSALRRFGDVERARGQAAARYSSSYGCGPQTHCCMEPLSAIAEWSASDGILNLWAPTQSPRNISSEVAHMLDLDPASVRVHRVGVGGDFGARVKTGTLEVIVSQLSVATGKPVMIQLSRDDEFAFGKRQHETWIDITSHYDGEGRILGRDAQVTVDNGAFIQGGSNQMNYCSVLLGSQYALTGAEINGQSVYTNKAPGGAFRGAGGPQAAFAIECQMDEIADELAIDPIDLRLRNLTAEGGTTITGWQIASSAAAECLTEVRRRLNWDEARELRGSGRGVGVALAMHVSGAVVSPATGYAGIVIEIGQNGGIVVSSGCADPGTGEYAVLQQLAAAELGVCPDRIDLMTMDTLKTPFDPGAGSSRATMVTGTAVVGAAKEMAAELRAEAARLFDCGPDDVILADGHASYGERREPIGKVAASHPLAVGGTLRVEKETSVGIEPVPLSHADSGYGNLSPAYAFAAHGVEVEVDRETGVVRVLRVVAVHDAGTVVNPTGAKGQVVGGVAMGLGAALGEQLLWYGGRPHITGFVDYAMPRSDDMPPIEVAFVGKPDPRGPAGAKSISELALMPIAAAVANAIAHATGARLRQLPITPDKICTALEADPQMLSTTVRWKPRRWRSEIVRRAYPLGLFGFLDRFGPSVRRTVENLPIAKLERPTSAIAATKLLCKAPGSRPLGGGTDLLPARASGLSTPNVLVSLAKCTDLSGLREDKGDLILGAGLKLAELHSALEGADLSGDAALGFTAGSIATSQIREMATLAGNLCQANRCWFLRSGFDCYKRGGPGRPCYAILGDHRYYHAVADAGRCQSVTPSDLATMLSALDAEFEVLSSLQKRRIAAGSFYTGPGENCLSSDEIITAVRIPAASRKRPASFRKLALSSDGFSIASVAASFSLDQSGRIETARIVLGGIAATPWRALATERSLTGCLPTTEKIEESSQAWFADTHPLKGNRWKLRATAGLIRQACKDAL